MTNDSTWPSQTNSTVFADLVSTMSNNSTAKTVAASVEWGAVALGLIVMATVFGNSLLCMAVVTEKRLQNMTNYFLASLAVADLLVAVVVMPLAVVVQIYGTVRHVFQELKFSWGW